MVAITQEGRQVWRFPNIHGECVLTFEIKYDDNEMKMLAELIGEAVKRLAEFCRAMAQEALEEAAKEVIAELIEESFPRRHNDEILRIIRREKIEKVPRAKEVCAVQAGRRPTTKKRDNLWTADNGVSGSFPEHGNERLDNNLPELPRRTTQPLARSMRQMQRSRRAGDGPDDGTGV